MIQQIETNVENKHTCFITMEPRGNGIMDSARACCAGDPGSIPTVGKLQNNCNIQMVFLPLGIRG